jgi:hypothetical protein
MSWGIEWTTGRPLDYWFLIFYFIRQDKASPEASPMQVLRDLLDFLLLCQLPDEANRKQSACD